MSAVLPCVPTSCCSTPLTVSVPGSTGNSAVTVTTASFTLPAVGGTTSTPAIAVGDTSWMKAGKNVYISDGAKFANFIVISVDSATAFTGRFLGLVGDSASGTMASGAVVMPGLGNFTVPYDLDLLTPFTDNSGGTKSDTIAATVARQTIFGGAFPMATIANGTVWGIAIPFNFTVVSVLLKIDVAVTTVGKAATFTTRVNTVNTTGGVISASGTYSAGGSQAGTSISGNNTGTAGQIVDLLVSGVTAFTEGAGHLEIVVLNTDLAATIAAIAFKANQLRTALRHQ